MNIIKRQINYINLPSLRQRINFYMPQVEKYLTATNLPQDFKYLAIVESGFKTDAQSGVGAVGFWQLMPATARERNLVVNDLLDERKDFDKSTIAAFQVLASYYLDIRKSFSVSSWVLTAAAYNIGIGRIKKAINKQGKNYFSMNLNPETAAYVYKIIAIKELFEYPELYMKDFGYNIFNVAPSSKTKKISNKYETDISSLGSMKVDVDESDGQHPVDLKKQLVIKKTSKTKETITLVTARIAGKYKRFKDGDVVTLVLEDELKVQNRYSSPNTTIQGRGWLIDNRIMVDLGFGHFVTLFDLSNEKGISKSKLKNKEVVILKVAVPVR